MKVNNKNCGVSNSNIEVECPKCGTALNASPDQAGTDAECPCCGITLRIPTTALSAAPPCESSQQEDEPGGIIVVENTFGGQLGRIVRLCVFLAILVLAYKILTFQPDTGSSPLQKLSDSASSLSHAFGEMRFFTSKNEIAARAAFQDYHAALDEGDYPRAIEHLKTVDSLIPDAKTKTSFWNHVSKNQGEIGALTILLSCRQCGASGQCADCTGTGLCAQCGGGGVCPDCNGVNSRTTSPCGTCDNHLCRICKGRGVVYCKRCQGFLKIDCPKCGGSGNLLVSSKIPCTACEGKGYKVGLRNGTKNNVMIVCIRCNGKKYEEVSSLEKCTSCGHSGRMVCPDCLGNRNCPNCNGNGRKAEPCQVCGGTGIAETVCRSCNGKATCAGCTGSGTCAVCHGDKRCRDCGGRGLVDCMELPVSMRWISLGHGIWHAGAEGAAPVKLDADASDQVVVNGRKVSVPRPGINEVVVVVDAMPQGRFKFLGAE